MQLSCAGIPLFSLKKYLKVEDSPVGPLEALKKESALKKLTCILMCNKLLEVSCKTYTPWFLGK